MTRLSPRTVLILLAATALTTTAAPSYAARHHARHHASDSKSSTYKVRRGDTLEAIARKLGTDIDTLADLNGLKSPYRLMAGEVLKTPGGGGGERTAARDEDRPKTYTVERGDTLYGIAKKFGLSVDDLRDANGMSNRSKILRGQKLKLPGAADDKKDEPVVASSKSHRETKASSDDGETVSGRAAQGRMVDVDGPRRTYRVRRGDTASEVADRFGMSLTELARINHLKKPYRIRRGQVLKGEPTHGKAYVVASGDTLSEIADRFGVSEKALRSANGLGRRSNISAGRKLHLPAGARDHEGASTQRASTPDYAPRKPQYDSSSRAELPDRPQPYVAPPKRPPPGSNGAVFGAPLQTPTPSDTQLSQMARGVFIWPLRGDVIQGFGPRAGGQANDGVDIRASAGEPVRAAAAGEVVYAGDQIPGYGNLVLIQHSDGWVTAYGHLARLDVRMQQKVTQGQQIGEAGDTGGVSEPQLHFEVRYRANLQERAKPVDPKLVLPMG